MSAGVLREVGDGLSHRVPSGLLRRSFSLDGGREALGIFEGCNLVRPLLQEDPSGCCL